MKVIIVQADLIWENAEANRARLTEIIQRSEAGKDDLVVLPEMFSSGFTMNSASMAENMDGETISWMKALASSGGYALAGSIIIEENKSYYNRLVIVYDGETMATYDKGHLFRMEKENNFFTSGTDRVTTVYKGFSINLQICYDLRFPVWSRNIENTYDILLYVANWPESRRHVWNTLLKARAIENQSYVIGVNRIGKDGNGISYSGDSQIIDPKGYIIADFQSGEEGTASAVLSIKDLSEFRNKFPVWKDADSFELL